MIKFYKPIKRFFVMALKEKDFVRIEFIGKVKDGGVFDSNISSEMKKADLKGEAKPFV